MKFERNSDTPVRKKIQIDMKNIKSLGTKVNNFNFYFNKQYKYLSKNILFLAMLKNYLN